MRSFKLVYGHWVHCSLRVRRAGRCCSCSLRLLPFQRYWWRWQRATGVREWGWGGQGRRSSGWRWVNQHNLVLVFIRLICTLVVPEQLLICSHWEKLTCRVISQCHQSWYLGKIHQIKIFMLFDSALDESMDFVIDFLWWLLGSKNIYFFF